MKISRMIACAVAVSALAAGCGGGDDDKADQEDGASSTYCTDLKSVASDIKRVQSGKFDQFGDMVGKFPTLADEAPESIKEDWQIFSQAFLNVEKKFADSGISLGDLAVYQSGEKKLPKDLDLAKLEAAATAYRGIATEKVVAASKA
ncbi:hypothetical protein M3147_18930, partial [Agromyces mediolanus]|uniref:hypothetical protein n=1 Tax=Agromyces mediolanus TaxID=41986 RepID=UPI00203AF406